MDDLKASLLQECTSEYLKTWFAPRTLLEMLYYRRLIPQYQYQDLLRVVLSRAVRSSRLVPHYDLATPKAPLPVGEKYWCKKHNRYCVPIDNCITKIHSYSGDTERHIAEFDRLRSDKTITVIQADSRTVDLRAELANTVIANRPIDGIFTSPPYVGQIDYHDQHIYAYELFGFRVKMNLRLVQRKKVSPNRHSGNTLRASLQYFEMSCHWSSPTEKSLL